MVTSNGSMFLSNSAKISSRVRPKRRTASSTVIVSQSSSLGLIELERRSV
jgi:hypothetical protein